MADPIRTLSERAARQLSNTTKTPPQWRGVTPRWLVQLLPSWDPNALASLMERMAAEALQGAAGPAASPIDRVALTSLAVPPAPGGAPAPRPATLAPEADGVSSPLAPPSLDAPSSPFAAPLSFEGLLGSTAPLPTSFPLLDPLQPGPFEHAAPPARSDVALDPLAGVPAIDAAPGDPFDAVALRRELPWAVSSACTRGLP